MAGLKRRVVLNTLLSVVVAFFGYGAVGAVRQLAATRAEVRGYEQHVRVLRSREQELSNRRKEFAYPEAFERYAKERLNLKLPGEMVAVIVPPAATSSSARVPQSWIQRFRLWITGK